MPKIQIMLTCLVLILIGLIIYQYQAHANLDSWIKGVAILCIIAFFARMFEKYRGRPKEK